MLSAYARIQEQRAAGNLDRGFTLIELLIVIVVLGILAAVVIFALGGITGKSAAASCSADGATISTALAAFNAENPGVLNGASAAIVTATAQTDLTATAKGGPFIQSWPSNLPHYAFEIASFTAATTPVTYNAIVKVATGNTGPVAGVYTPTVAAGALVATGGTPATSIPGGTNAPWLGYVGPVACTGVQ